MCQQKDPTGQPRWMFVPVSGSYSSASAALQLPGGDTELRMLQRAPRDAGFALWEEGRVNRGVTNPHQVHTAHVAPISHTLSRTRLLCSVRASNSEQPLWPRDGSSCGKCWVHPLNPSCRQPECVQTSAQKLSGLACDNPTTQMIWPMPV